MSGVIQVGTRVYWTPDCEEGTIVATTPDAIAVRWDVSGWEWYARTSGALERIEPFNARGKELLAP